MSAVSSEDLQKTGIVRPQATILLLLSMKCRSKSAILGHHLTHATIKASDAVACARI